MDKLQAVLSNTWATVVLLVAILAFTGAMLYLKVLTVEEVKIALLYLLAGSTAAWHRGSKPLPTVVDLGEGR